MMKSFVLKALVGAIGIALMVRPGQAAIVLGTINDFQDGTTQGWIHAKTHAGSPINVADAGPAGAGDHALQIVSTGAGQEGSRYLAFNLLSNWTGDYTGTGVTSIQFDVNNTGNSSLSLRLALTGAGGWFVTDPVIVNPDGVWQTSAAFDVTAAGLTGVGGATNVAGTLSNVTQAQVMSAVGVPSLGVGGRPRGDVIAASALFDNFTAVPEPTSIGLLVSGALLVCRRRRRDI